MTDPRTGPWHRFEYRSSHGGVVYAGRRSGDSLTGMLHHHLVFRMNMVWLLDDPLLKILAAKSRPGEPFIVYVHEDLLPGVELERVV